MIIYASIMFAIALIFIVVGGMIGNGKLKLIHEYHQSRVKDKEGYGKAMGGAVIGISVPMILSGVTALLITAESIIPIVIVVIGLAISMIPIVMVQKKYNGGIFSVTKVVHKI